MDQVPDELFPQSGQDRYLDVAYSERWERLKSVIVRLYLGNYGQGGKATTVNQVAEFMRENYFFHAAPTQYRTRFRSWNISKRVVKDIKDDVASTIARRKRPGESTSQITFVEGGRVKQLHPSKLIRHLKEQHHHPLVEAIAPGLLTSWNLPYKAFAASIHKEIDKPSPFGTLATTPENLNIKSPTPLSPGHDAPGPSPNTQLVYQKARERGAALFLQGRLEQLVVGMCREDRKLLVDYFHDFYIYGFTMAKEWGNQLRRPQSGPDHLPVWRQPNTVESPMSSTAFGSPSQTNIADPPTQLCNWSIHLAPLDSDLSAALLDASPQRPEVPAAQPPAPSFVETLRQSIVCNSFTNTLTDTLPIAQDHIVCAIEKDPNALEVDAWKLAIMATNYELIFQMYKEMNDEVPEGLSEIYPFHLAAAFLDGGDACCQVFETLVYCLGTAYPFYQHIDNHRHTILDALIVSILRSHTVVSPASVSSDFRSPNRFPGEETDICGRWTTDTPEVRELFKHGAYRIPSAWKHPFCHTAVQAVCHCITGIYASASAPNINRMSGLFTRRCTECGLELKLAPLHTLVVTTFYLARSDRPGETLFGAIAVLVCLLSLGADASLKANISAEKILEHSDAGECSHSYLSPLELMQKVPQDIIDGWGEDCQVGWHCISQILYKAEEGRRSKLESTSIQASKHLGKNKCSFKGMDGENHPPWMNLTCYDADIGLLWATIQTEFLTYRRIEEGDPWVSENFSIRALKDWLSGDSPVFQTPLVTEGMMREHSRCGWFKGKKYHEIYPPANVVSTSYFMNMDIYDRASYLGETGWKDMWAEAEPLEEEEDWT